MKLLSAMNSSWCMAISLHVGLLAFLIAWPSLGKIQTLPQNNASISAYIMTPVSAQAGKTQITSLKLMNLPGVDAQKLTRTTYHAALLHRIQQQRIAPQNIQIILRDLAQTIQQHLVYPDLASRHIQQGSSIIDFTLQPNGAIGNIQVAQSSGVTDLDQAAIAAVKASSPLAMPVLISQSIHLSLPVDFTMS